MITDAKVRADIGEQWQTVQKLSRGVIRTTGVLGGTISETPLDEHFNLPFVLAFAVLDQVLSELITEKVFSCSRWQLGAKMLASKGAISWKDYAMGSAPDTAGSLNYSTTSKPACLA
jgi:hypothetical protein